MDEELKEFMYKTGRDDIDELVKNIVKIERSFKNRSSSKASRRNQIEGEISSFINKHSKEADE